MPRNIIAIDEIIGDAKRLLAETNVSVKDMAKQFGYNRDTAFHGAFKRKMGETPEGYRLRKRMVRAKKLLVTTNDFIDVIGVKVGYASGENFSDAFLREVGEKPTDYRRCKKHFAIDRFKYLLAKTNMPIEDIAIKWGYNRLSTFSVAFKKAAGETPSAYRAREGAVVESVEEVAEEAEAKWLLAETAISIQVISDSWKRNRGTDFRATFKQRMGESASEYRLRKKIEKAQELLIETDKSVKRVAVDVGFSTAGYFGTVLVRETGETPTEYRNRAKLPTIKQGIMEKKVLVSAEKARVLREKREKEATTSLSFYRVSDSVVESNKKSCADTGNKKTPLGVSPSRDVIDRALNIPVRSVS